MESLPIKFISITAKPQWASTPALRKTREKFWSGNNFAKGISLWHTDSIYTNRKPFHSLWPLNPKSQHFLKQEGKWVYQASPEREGTLPVNNRQCYCLNTSSNHTNGTSLEWRLSCDVLLQILYHPNVSLQEFNDRVFPWLASNPFRTQPSSEHSSITKCYVLKRQLKATSNAKKDSTNFNVTVKSNLMQYSYQKKTAWISEWWSNLYKLWLYVVLQDKLPHKTSTSRSIFLRWGRGLF